MAKFVCKVCGYVYEGDAAPAECPVCHVGADMFEEVKGEMKLAAEHEYGIYAKTVKNNPDISDEDKKYIFDQLKANFRPEFLNRVDEIITFKALDLASIKDIVRLALKSVEEKLKDRYIQLDFSEDVIKYLAENAYEPQYGARPLRRYIQKELETSLAKLILSNEIKERDKVDVVLENDEIKFKVKNKN